MRVRVFVRMYMRVCMLAAHHDEYVYVAIRYLQYSTIPFNPSYIFI